MTLAKGDRLGPYEIVAPLGAGGMGEVYRARDTRLGRDVALKVLPKELTADAGRLRRFEQEARAASALQHPNILVVHDVGTSGDAPYLVTELLEGQTLRERLSAGALSPRDALDISIPVAQGLAAAHEKGIVHRDLKPENLFISRDGFVKILDFGIAKLVMPEAEGVSQLPTDTPHATGSGVVLGTVAYMSPEQAGGRSVDARSDQFSLGSILYEMLAGRRPFDRETSAETLVAILREDPEALGTVRPGTPPVLSWIADRCLAKDPAERYLSTRDLAHELKAVREHISRASGPSAASGAIGAATAPVPGRRPFEAKVVAALGLAAAIALGAGFLLGRRARAPSAQPVFTPLTFRRGIIHRARFAPGGKTVIYSAGWDGGPPEIFTTRPESPESKSLGLPPAQLLSVSPKGELAILLTRGHNPNNIAGTLARLPMTGGTPRPVLEDVYDADWSPDGEQLCVRRAVGGKERIEFPIGKVILEGTSGSPRFLPPGDRVAIDTLSGIETVDLAGKRTMVLRSGLAIFGLAWHPRADEIWYTEGAGPTNRALYAVSLAGRVRPVYRAPGSLIVQDISADGHLLVVEGKVREGILALPPGEAHLRDLSVLVRSVIADLSRDGRTLLINDYTEAGGVVYIRGTDGSPSVRLAAGEALALSPDGKRALCRPPGPVNRLVEVPTGPGETREVDTRGLPMEKLWDARWPAGAKRLFVCSGQSETRMRVFVREGEGGWRPVTPEGAGGEFVVSPEGGRIAVDLPSGGIGIYSVAGGEPRTLEGRGPIHWTADGSALLVRTFGAVPLPVERLDLSTGKRTLWKELMPSDPAGVVRVGGTIRIAADERSYAFSYGRTSSELYLAEGLK